MKFILLSSKLLKLTFPLALAEIKKNKLRLFILIFLSVLLGAIPAIKSELEAALIQQADVATHTKDTKFDQFLSSKLQRLNKDQDDNDFLEKVSHIFFRDYPLMTDLYVYGFLVLLTWLISIVLTKIKSSFTLQMFTTIRNKGFTTILEKDPFEFPPLLQQTGRYANSIHQGTMNITSTYSYLIDAIQYLVTLTTALILLGSINIWFSVLFFGLLVIQVLISFLQNRLLKKQRNKLDDTRNHLSAYTEEILSKKEIILAFDQGEKYEDRLNIISEDYGKVDRKLEIKESIFSGLSTLVSDLDRILLPVFVVWAIIFWKIEGESKIGDIYFVISLFTRLSYPALRLLNKYTDMKKSEAMSESFLKILEMEPKTQTQYIETSEPLTVDQFGIEFSNVDFKYQPEGKMILKDCTFQIPKGKVSLIIGPSGCGKSTIAKLILGYWEKQAGEIFVDNKNIESYTDKKELRKLLSYISQGDHIVEETVYENLNWPVDGIDIPRENMLIALKQVGLYPIKGMENILELPAKDLSGGQQQRLSLARILLDDSDILILDEPLTGVDVKTINEVLPYLGAKIVADNNTVIIISHKVLFAKYADHVVLFNETCDIEEAGDPKVLVKQSDSKLKELINASIEQLTF